VTFGEQLLLETESGMSYNEWIADGVAEERAVACQILIWFLRRKAGRQEDRMSIDPQIRKLDIEEIVEVVDADPEASAASEAAGSPTSPESTESGLGSSNGSPVLISP